MINSRWKSGPTEAFFPENAVAYAAKILKEQMTIFINFDEELEPVPAEKSKDKTKPKFNENLYRSVEELELSVRSANCLKNADINQIWQLVSKTEGEMLKTKNFGRKSLNEIKEVLSEMDLSLGLKLEGFVPPLKKTMKKESNWPYETSKSQLEAKSNHESSPSDVPQYGHIVV